MHNFLMKLRNHVLHTFGQLYLLQALNLTDSKLKIFLFHTTVAMVCRCRWLAIKGLIYVEIIHGTSSDHVTQKASISRPSAVVSAAETDVNGQWKAAENQSNY